MSLVLLAVITALAVLAFGCSIVSLLLHWKRPNDANAELATLQNQVHNTQLGLTDLTDRVQQWIKRDNVRRSRAAKEEQTPLSLGTGSETAAPNNKAALRSAWLARKAGGGTEQ